MSTHDGLAAVCAGSVCAPVDAPLPGATISTWADAGSLTIGYAPPDGAAGVDHGAVLAFQAAVNGAADAVAGYVSANSKAPDKTAAARVGGQQRRMV